MPCLHSAGNVVRAHFVFSPASAIGKCHSPFSRASICSWVKDVLFLCSFLFSWSLIWASSESSPLELMELVFSPPPSCCGQPSVEPRESESEMQVPLFEDPYQRNNATGNKFSHVC